MVSDNLRREAAERYAEKNGMTIHEVFEDEDFRKTWNIFRSNPNSKVARRALGITQKRLQKESADERESFRSVQSIRRYPVAA